MANRVHRYLKVIAFNANGIMRQRHQFNKQLQDLHIDVALFSETHPKLDDRTAVAVKKGHPPHECKPTSPHFSRSNRSLHTYW
jgi:exonuclease III